MSGYHTIYKPVVACSTCTWTPAIRFSRLTFLQVFLCFQLSPRSLAWGWIAVGRWRGSYCITPFYSPSSKCYFKYIVYYFIGPFWTFCTVGGKEDDTIIHHCIVGILTGCIVCTLHNLIVAAMLFMFFKRLEIWTRGRKKQRTRMKGKRRNCLFPKWEYYKTYVSCSWYLGVWVVTNIEFKCSQCSCAIVSSNCQMAFEKFGNCWVLCLWTVLSVKFCCQHWSLI